MEVGVEAEANAEAERRIILEEGESSTPHLEHAVGGGLKIVDHPLLPPIGRVGL